MKTTQEWFEELYKDYMKQLVKAAKKFLHDKELAIDLVHDTFIVALIKEDDVRAHENPRLWLYKVLYNQIGNEMQRQRYRDVTSLELCAELGQNDTYFPALTERLPPGLKEKDREILIMFFEQRLSHEEMAARLGCSVGNCRTKLFRAKERCRELYLQEKIKNSEEKCNVLPFSSNI